MTSRAVVLANLASSNILEVDSTTDRVGIGSTQPTTRLDVSGNIKAVHGNFTGVVTATSFSGDGTNLTGVARTDFIVGTAITMTTGTFNGPVTIGGTLTYEDVTNIDSVGVITARSGIDCNGTATFGANGSITTGSNFSLNGNALTVTGASTVVGEFKKAGSPTIQVTDTTNSTDLQLRADATGGLVRTASNKPLLFATNQTERLRITSGGKVGINITNPDDYNSSGNELVLGKTGNNSGMTIVSGTANSGTIFFADGTGSNAAIRGTIKYEHNNNALAFNTDTAERMRIDSSGRLLLGTATSPTAGNGQYANIVVQGYPNTPAGAGHISLQRGQTAFGADNQIGLINFGDSTGASYAGIECYADADSGSSDYPGRLVFSTTADGASSPTERIRIDSSGNVNFPGTDPIITTGFNMYLRTPNNIEINGDSDSSGSGYIDFRIGSSSKAKIDNSGRMLIGATSNTSVASESTRLQVVGDTNDSSRVSIINNGNNGGGGGIQIAKSRGAGGTIVQNNDEVGHIIFAAGDGTDFNSISAQISCEIDGGPGGNDVPGRLTFKTTADGASSPTERMRILNDGNIGFNCTFRPASGHNGVFFDSNIITIGSNTTAGQDRMRFENPNNRVGSISASATGVSYNTSSDYRLKENVVDITDGITRVKQLSPRRFNFIADDTTTVDGFLAHEAQTVVPEAVTGMHNEVDDDGKAVMQNIDQSKLVPLLTAALQEAIVEIESLKTRVAALESS